MRREGERPGRRRNKFSRVAKAHLWASHSSSLDSLASDGSVVHPIVHTQNCKLPTELYTSAQLISCTRTQQYTRMQTYRIGRVHSLS